MPSRSPLCSILFRGGSTRPPIAGRRGEVGPTLDRRYPARLRSFQKQPERSARLQPTSIESGHSPSAYTSVRSSVSWSDSTNVIPSSNCGRSYPPIRRALSVDSTSGWNVYRLPSNFRSSRSAAIDWTDRRASVLSPSTTTRRSMSLALSASPRQHYRKGRPLPIPLPLPGVLTEMHELVGGTLPGEWRALGPAL